KVAKVPGVTGVGPFIINPMMVSHDDKTATGVLLKGVDPERMLQVLDLPRHIRTGGLAGLRRPGGAPPAKSGELPPSLLPVPPTPGKGLAPAPAGSSGALDSPRDNEGRNVALLRAIEATLHEESPDPAASAARPPPRPEKQREEPLPSEPQADLPRSAPRGSIVPQGGYKSALPADDALPDDVDPDPCRSPEVVRQMPGIVVGSTLAKNIGVSIGDCMQVTSPTIGYAFSQGSVRPPIAKQFRVIAIFEAGFDQYDSKLVYTDLFEAQGFYDQGDTVTGVEMKVADIDNARSISRVIDKMLANGLYHTMDWEELNHGLFTALRIQKASMSLVLFLIIFVAAFTVIATLIMIVLEKKKEIAVLKAMGATNDAILRTFLYQGGFIGAVGTGLGLFLGIIVCKVMLVYALPLDPKVYFISHLPVEVSVEDFLITGASSMVICLIATVVPALYAAWLRPADGFRAQ
ncbi:MAG TPA: ABC transporter permease, partial [Polyangiaceae bacterium]|nr:ABC transporter permease [Polyangiaceae bacterium]